MNVGFCSTSIFILRWDLNVRICLQSYGVLTHHVRSSLCCCFDDNRMTGKIMGSIAGTEWYGGKPCLFSAKLKLDKYDTFHLLLFFKGFPSTPIAILSSIKHILFSFVLNGVKSFKFISGSSVQFFTAYNRNEARTL